VALVHIEVETRQSAAALRPRMFEYYADPRIMRSFSGPTRRGRERSSTSVRIIP
jgi:hypothetical protein